MWANVSNGQLFIGPKTFQLKDSYIIYGEDYNKTGGDTKAHTSNIVKAKVELLEVKIIIVVSDSDIWVRMEVLNSKKHPFIVRNGMFSISILVTQPHFEL